MKFFLVTIKILLKSYFAVTRLLFNPIIPKKQLVYIEQTGHIFLGHVSYLCETEQHEQFADFLVISHELHCEMMMALKRRETVTLKILRFCFLKIGFFVSIYASQKSWLKSPDISGCTLHRRYLVRTSPVVINHRPIAINLQCNKILIAICNKFAEIILYLHITIYCNKYFSKVFDT